MTDRQSPPSFDETAAKVRTLIVTSRRLMAEGRLIDLSQIEGRIKTLCELAQTLPNGDKEAARGTLKGLLGDLDNAQDELEGQFGTALSARPHRDAAQAYAQAYNKVYNKDAAKGDAPPDTDTGTDTNTGIDTGADIDDPRP